MNNRTRGNQDGFTIAELLVASTVFLLMAAGAFSLLNSSTQRFKTDSQVLTSFQEARLGIDQITRDIADAGFPPRNHFSALTTPTNIYTAGPFGWAPSYPVAPCTLGGTCSTPSPFDLIIETDYGGTGANAGVRWIRYQLPAGGTTLFRADVPKTVGGLPDVATSAPGVLLPYLQNVMNNASGAQINSIRSAYSSMFPGGNPVPMFTYTCDVTGSNPTPCTVANNPSDIRDVDIVLIVQSLSLDGQVHSLRLVELHGLGHRLNPNQ
jgi:prepilin-type N-terminal cleavage/methylation domain-containing protein